MQRTPCPHCLRPMGFEYRDVEAGVCHLWRQMNESTQVSPRALADCFGHTSRRLRELEAKIADTEQRLKAAQRALSRHHDREVTQVEPFRDGARIE